jgi:hypothetical protein
MPFLNPSKAVVLTLTEMATLSVADGKDVVVVPCDMELYRVHMKLGTTGGTSGNTDVTVYYTAPSGGSTSSGDLWTVGTGVGRIAYNASNKYLNWTRDNLAVTRIEAGGTLSLNVDSVPSTASSYLTVDIVGVPQGD